jgi:hypothetical protein
MVRAGPHRNHRNGSGGSRARRRRTSGIRETCARHSAAAACRRPRGHGPGIRGGASARGRGGPSLRAFAVRSGEPAWRRGMARGVPALERVISSAWRRCCRRTEDSAMAPPGPCQVDPNPVNSQEPASGSAHLAERCSLSGPRRPLGAPLGAPLSPPLAAWACEIGRGEQFRDGFVRDACGREVSRRYGVRHVLRQYSDDGFA